MVAAASLGEWLPADHAMRFVAEFVDNLDWATVGIQTVAERSGAPPMRAVLLAAWLSGFMTGIRSSRKLEQACAENIPMMWLSGLQRPTTVPCPSLSAEPPAMRPLFKATVRLAIAVGLVDFALQAVDGTRWGRRRAAACAVRPRSPNRSPRSSASWRRWMAAERVEAAADAPPLAGLRSRLGQEQIRSHLRAAQAELARRRPCRAAGTTWMR